MKGLQAGIPLTLLAAVARVHADPSMGETIGHDVSAPIKHEFDHDIVGFAPDEHSHKRSMGETIGHDVSAPIKHKFDHDIVGFAPKDDKKGHGEAPSGGPEGHHKARSFDEGNNAAIPMTNVYSTSLNEFKNEDDHSVEVEGKDRPHPPLAHNPARHPPMGNTARAFSPDETHSLNEGSAVAAPAADAPSSQAQPVAHGPSAIPTCSTRTQHVVHTVTKTVTSHSRPSHPVPVYSQNVPYGLDPLGQYSTSHPVLHSTPAVMGQQQSSVEHMAQAPATPTSSPGNAPIPPVIAGQSAAPSTHSPAQHSAAIGAIPMATSSSSDLLHAPPGNPTASVHSAHSVIPVHVPMSSHSSIKLHGASASPSSALPSAVDPNRFHGTFAPSSSPSAGVAFTGAGAQLAPNTGIVSAVCGLLGLLAYVL